MIFEFLAIQKLLRSHCNGRSTELLWQDCNPWSGETRLLETCCRKIKKELEKVENFGAAEKL